MNRARQPHNTASLHQELTRLTTYRQRHTLLFDGGWRLDLRCAAYMHGKPLEPYGMSNNVRVVGGKDPTFDVANLVLPAEGVQCVIELQ